MSLLLLRLLNAELGSHIYTKLVYFISFIRSRYILQGGGPQLEENPTGTIPETQAIEQQAEHVYKYKQ